MGYLYPGHEIFGAGAIPFRMGDQLRLDSRCSVNSIVLQPTAKIVPGTTRLGGWGGVFQGSLEGPGIIRSITGTDPAAGLNFSEAVPTNARWDIRSIFFSFFASAIVASRNVNIDLGDGSNIFSRKSATVGGTASTQTAGETFRYTFARGIDASLNATTLERQYPLPDIGALLQAYTIASNISNLQTGDNLGAPQYVVEEWIEE